MNIRLSVTVIVLILSGCASTSRVSVFSKTAIEGLELSKEIPYSFDDHCINIHDLNNYNKANSGQTIDLFSKTDCSSFRKVDSGMNALHAVLLAFFKGMQKLSDDGTVDINIEKLTKNFKKGSYYTVELTDKEVTAVNSISNKLLSAIASGYRNNKVKEFLSGSDEPITSIISKLQDFYELMNTSLELERSTTLIVYTPHIRDTSQKYLQILALKDYSSQILLINNKEKQVRSYINTLEKLKKGYHEVVSAMNTMNKKEWQQLIISEASDLFALIDQFNKK